jgi:hypothetical protein
MNAIGLVITKFFDVLLLPFGQTHQTLALVALSLLTGIGMAYVFKLTSNQKRIKVAKDRFKARVLEMRIYQDDPVLILSGFFGAMKMNLFYLSTVLKPFFILILPVVIVFMQMDERFSRYNLDKGETTLLTVTLKEGFDPISADVSLACGDGVVEDSKPVRIRDSREIDWRLRVVDAGAHEMTLSAGDHSYSFPLVADPAYRMIGHTKSASSFIEPLLHPALPPTPKDGPFQRVAIHYPGRSYSLFGWHTHWIVIFLFYSLLGALALKFLLKIEI